MSGARAGMPRAGGRDRASVAPPHSALRALRDLVLAPPSEPAAGPSPPSPSPPPVAPALGVLCAAGDAWAVGVAAGSLLTGRRRGAAALACVWTGADPGGGVERRSSATGAARRLAGALCGRGLAADARGRVAVAALPAAPDDALAATRRALAAAGEAPTVLVLGGARDAAFDVLLAEQDRVVVLSRPGGEAVVGELAAAGVAVLGVPVLTSPVALRPGARAIARSGLAIPAGLRRALGPALEGRR